MRYVAVIATVFFPGRPIRITPQVQVQIFILLEFEWYSFSFAWYLLGTILKFGAKNMRS